MFGHRALKALAQIFGVDQHCLDDVAQNISGVQMAAPLCRIVQVAGMIPERPKDEGRSWDV